MEIVRRASRSDHAACIKPRYAKFTRRLFNKVHANGQATFADVAIATTVNDIERFDEVKFYTTENLDRGEVIINFGSNHERGNEHEEYLLRLVGKSAIYIYDNYTGQPESSVIRKLLLTRPNPEQVRINSARVGAIVSKIAWEAENPNYQR